MLNKEVENMNEKELLIKIANSALNKSKNEISDVLSNLLYYGFRFQFKPYCTLVTYQTNNKIHDICFLDASYVDLKESTNLYDIFNRSVDVRKINERNWVDQDGNIYYKSRNTGMIFREGQHYGFYYRAEL